MQNQKGNIILIIAGIIAILAIGGGVGYFFAQESMQKEQAMEQVQKQEQKIQQEVKDETADASAIASATADWKTYRNEKYGFEVKYPNEFTQKEIENTIILKDEKRGHVSIFVTPEKLDPKNIQGLYGKIENPILVKVGNKDGYQHRDGDAGCEAQIVQADLNGKILKISFGSCDLDLANSVSRDQNLINQVLSTFKFTK